MLIVVGAKLLADEIVHVHQELGCGARTRQHAAHHEHHVDEAAAERLEVGGSCRVATNRCRSTDKPWIHRYRSTIVGKAGLIVLVDEMVGQHVNILVCQRLAIHLLYAVGEQAAVKADEARLGQLTNERGDVLMLHVGVGIIL